MTLVASVIYDSSLRTHARRDLSLCFDANYGSSTLKERILDEISSSIRGNSSLHNTCNALVSMEAIYMTVHVHVHQHRDVVVKRERD